MRLVPVRLRLDDRVHVRQRITRLDVGQRVARPRDVDYESPSRPSAPREEPSGLAFLPHGLLIPERRECPLLWPVLLICRQYLPRMCDPLGRLDHGRQFGLARLRQSGCSRSSAWVSTLARLEAMCLPSSKIRLGCFSPVLRRGLAFASRLVCHLFDRLPSTISIAALRLTRSRRRHKAKLKTTRISGLTPHKSPHNGQNGQGSG